MTPQEVIRQLLKLASDIGATVEHEELEGPDTGLTVEPWVWLDLAGTALIVEADLQVMQYRVKDEEHRVLWHCAAGIDPSLIVASFMSWVRALVVAQAASKEHAHGTLQTAGV